MKMDEGTEQEQDSINDTQFVFLNNDVFMSDYSKEMNYSSKNMRIVEYEHQEDAGPSYQQQQEEEATNSYVFKFSRGEEEEGGVKEEGEEVAEGEER